MTTINTLLAYLIIGFIIVGVIMLVERARDAQITSARKRGSVRYPTQEDIKLATAKKHFPDLYK